MKISLCIPTKDRAEYLRKTLESVDRDRVDYSLYEVVISDNSAGDDSCHVANSFIQKGMNIKYYKNPVLGFTNSIVALEQATGNFLKLHNDYTTFKAGGFARLVEFVNGVRESEPLVLFVDGNLTGGGVEYYDNFDKFLKASCYWNTWSSAFSIWASDFENLRRNSDLKLNSQFPHTSLLFGMSKKQSFVVFNESIFHNLNVGRKGGYNIFYNFSVVYFKMLKELEDGGFAERETVNKIIQSMEYSFFSRWISLTILDPVAKKNYSFDNSNWRIYLKEAYGFSGLIKIYMAALGYTLARRLKNCVN